MSKEGEEDAGKIQGFLNGGRRRDEIVQMEEKMDNDSIILSCIYM